MQSSDSDSNPASSLTDIPKKIHDFFHPPPKNSAPPKDPYATPVQDSAAYKPAAASSNTQAQSNRQAKTAKKYKGANGGM